MIFCTNCGEQIEEDASFCPYCGQPMDDMAADGAAEDAQYGENDLGSEETVVRGDGMQALPEVLMPEVQQPASAQTTPTQTATAQTPTQPIGVPDTQPVSPASPAAPSGGQPNGGGFKAWAMSHKAIVIIVAVVVVALLACGGVVYAYQSGQNAGLDDSEPSASPSTSKTTSASPSPSESTSTATSTPSSTPTPTKTAGLNAGKLDAIVNKYSASNSAVSVVPVNGGDSYTSQQGNSKYVASGLYLPVYLAAHGTNNSTASSYADAMMKTMSNDYANSAISSLGGLSSLNSWMSSAGYTNSDFERQFGDVSASSSGYENYASANDAARMLASVDQMGGSGLMAYSLASEGVTAPSGTTINGHRGQGIKNAYNFFIVMRTAKGSVGVAIMTQNQGRSVAVSLANDILAEVNAEMLQ